MSLSGPGLFRPVQHTLLTDEQEKRVSRACPGAGLIQEAGGRHDDPLWGPLVNVRSGYATEPTLRRTASSGGVLSALLIHLLESGMVDTVLQTAAAPELPIGNVTVLSTTSKDISRAAGSRYAPSAPLAGLEEHLVGGQRIAFVGKPCDVAALRAMERFDSRIAERIPIMLSFFCAGVPSLTGARKVLERLGVDEKDVAAFRYRGDGWPGFAAATLKDGSRRQMSYADSWGGILSKHVQWRCRICPDGTGGFADVACADAWEADERGYPVFDEREGLSLVVSRTQKGEDVVKGAMASGRIIVEPFAAGAISAIQPGQTQRRQFTLPRLIALRTMRRPAPVYRGFHLVRNMVSAGPKAAIRNFIGTIRRIARGRLQAAD